MKPKSVFANVSITGVGAKLLPTFSPDDQSDCLLSFFHSFFYFSFTLSSLSCQITSVHNNDNMTSSPNHAAAENDFPYF